MIEAMEKLFMLAHTPAACIKIHQEPSTSNCYGIESIGILVRTVKVEFIRFFYYSKFHYLVLVHTDIGSAVIVHNDDIIAEEPETGALIAKLIEKELELILVEAGRLVLNSIVDELIESTAIVKAVSLLTTEVADEFVCNASDNEYSTAVQLLNASKVQHEQ